MVVSDCLPVTQREAPHSKIILFHVLDSYIRTSASLRCEKSFNNDAQFLYHPFILKPLKHRAVAMKVGDHIALLGHGICKPYTAMSLHPSVLLMHGPAQRAEAWEPSRAARAQSEHRDSLQELSATLASALLIARGCSEPCSFCALRCPAASLILKGWSKGSCTSCN